MMPDAQVNRNVMRVLVCDDDAASRYVAKRVLSRVLGCHVVECGDGVEALELLSREPFDLAFIDLQLPRLSGYEVVEAIRQSENMRDLPVAILTQERSDNVVRDVLKLGVSAYITKPLRPDSLSTRIAALMARGPVKRASHSGDKHNLRLSPSTSAIIADGDANYRQFFSGVAGRYGTVIEAESGANALALFRRVPSAIIFVGSQLGVLGPEILVRKIRLAEGAHPVRVIGILGSAEPPASQARLFDATITRSFVPSTLRRDLRPFVQLSGPLASLDQAVPGIADCLVSGVTQVFGVMLGLELSVVDDCPWAEGGDSCASVDLEILDHHRLSVELRMPSSTLSALSAQLLGSEPDAVNEEQALSTVSELVNMVIGRLDTWLKEKGVAVHASLPNALGSNDAPLVDEPTDETGFTTAFAFTMPTGTPVGAKLYVRVASVTHADL